jgi:hypothetical protein
MWTTDLDLIRRCQELAHSYVDFAHTEIFMRDIHKPAKDADAEDVKGSDSSQDEEETEDEGNAGTITSRMSGLPWMVAELLFLLSDPALPMPTFPLLQLLLLVALLLPLLLRLALKTLKFYQIPGMPGAVVIYTQFALVCYLNNFYFDLLAY